MMTTMSTVYCGKCGLSFHEHTWDDYKEPKLEQFKREYPRRKKKRIYFCRCPNCKETIHKDNEMVKCCGEKFCWVCINDDHMKHTHPERYM